MIPLLIFSCKKEVLQETTKLKNSNANIPIQIPFETDASLTASGANSLEANHPIVHYKVMRALAYQEIQDNYAEDLNIKGNFSLSSYPVIIYNYNNTPAYYEFIVYQNNTPIATITTFAHKKTDDLIAFLLPFVRDYSLYNTTDDFYIGLYPGNPYIGNFSNYGTTPTTLYDKANDRYITPPPVSDIEKLEELYNMLPNDDKLEIGGGKEEIKQEILLEESEANTYWQIKFNDFEALIATSDGLYKTEWQGNKTTATIYGTPHYNNTNLQRTRWIGDCGPAVIAWIYRGLYSSYNNVQIRIHGDAPISGNFRVNNTEGRSFWDPQNPNSLSELNTNMGNSDGGLLHKIYDEGNTVWSGPTAGATMPTGMQNAIKKTTNSNYKASYVANNHLHIKNKGLPAFRMIGLHGQLHYICEFATKTVGTKKWFLVSDNGATMSGTPYWRNDTQAAFGFKYGINHN